MSNIDPKSLLKRTSFDSSVLVPALDSKSTESSAPMCKGLLEAILTERKTVVVPMPSLAERLIFGDETLLGLSGIELISFDLRSAKVLASKFGRSAITAYTKEFKVPKSVVKYDAMIVATAIAHRTDCLVTLDVRQRKMAENAGFRVCGPDAFTLSDGPLFDGLDQSSP